MKKNIIILALLMISMSLFADGDKTKKTNYQPDRTSANIGDAFNVYGGFGRHSYKGFGYSVFNVAADYEIQAFIPNLTIGPSVGIGIQSPPFDFFGGVAVHYYFDWLIPNMPDEFDVFITHSAGLNFFISNGFYGSFGWDTQIGGRWNFSDSWSLYAKAGYGQTIISVGLSAKF